MTSMDLRQDLFIGGDWVRSAQRFDVMDPAAEAVLASVSDATPEDGIAAVAAAHEAFGTVASMTPRQRAEVLRRAWEIMSAEAENVAKLIALENGKAWRDAMAETTYAAEFFRWFSEEAARVQGDFRKAPNGDKMIIVDHRPVGVAMMITPWNFPAAMATRKIAPAFAAGCSMVLKPAAETPLTALYIADIMERAGAPAGSVNVITTTHSGDVTSAILKDDRVKTLSFTGSTFVGKLLLKQASERVLTTSMELGGNAPFLVMEGADVQAAVTGAMIAKMRNGGAACTAANRFYVHASVADEFTKLFAKALGSLKIGHGTDKETELGAMVSIKERDKILDLVNQAKSEGVDVQETSQTPDKGAFIAPLVVKNVKHGSVLTREEVFGPVAPIVVFEDADDAVRMANDTEYGLISYVYAKDPGTGIKIARKMESGMVAINRGLASDPAAPFGGMKESGIGREGGFHGIHEFLETQYFAVDL